MSTLFQVGKTYKMVGACPSDGIAFHNKDKTFTCHATGTEHGICWSLDVDFNGMPSSFNKVHKGWAVAASKHITDGTVVEVLDE